MPAFDLLLLIGRISRYGHQCGCLERSLSFAIKSSALQVFLRHTAVGELRAHLCSAEWGQAAGGACPGAGARHVPACSQHFSSSPSCCLQAAYSTCAVRRGEAWPAGCQVPLTLWSAMPCFWLPASVCNSCILVALLFCFPHLHFCTACFVKASLLVQVRWFLLRFSDWSCSTKWNKGRRWRECKDAAEMFLARGCDLFPIRQRQTLEASFSMNV